MASGAPQAPLKQDFAIIEPSEEKGTERSRKMTLETIGPFRVSPWPL